MFDSKSPVVKVVGYIILGFLTLIIIISFGMPDFMSRLGVDQSTIAVVNGEKIHASEFLRFRDMYARNLKGMESGQQTQLILNNLIRYKLQQQLAAKIGIKVSDERVKQQIRSLPYFQDPPGTFSGERFKTIMSANRLTISDFYETVRSDLVNGEIMHLFKNGAGAVPDEVLKQYIMDNAQVQIQFCVVTTAELKERHRAAIAVTDVEIDDEMKKNRSEIKDPKTDRDRIRKKLEDKKFEAFRTKLLASIDELAIAGKSFGEAAALMRGRVGQSERFKIGEPVREPGPAGKALTSLSGSKVFVEDCLALETGKASKAISAGDGIYVFTPVQKSIPDSIPPTVKADGLTARLADERATLSYMAVMTRFGEKSKIIRNLKDKDVQE
ncbi:MAG TPA: SurA N-terminal domain-containing protein [Spirochaetota bacterium]|nr:SurA N-terminal domain-containing protein [Spirochaetota bacterium]HNT10542.1 SurA N-terminal domain-containing protein [Spirochaetota bacterium]HNV47555.1 SurA N-terminal domain-containing protein [Spirochaetota bacterium]